MADERFLQIMKRAEQESAVSTSVPLARDEDWSAEYAQAHEDRVYLLTLLKYMQDAFDIVAFGTINRPTMH